MSRTVFLSARKKLEPDEIIQQASQTFDSLGTQDRELTEDLNLQFKNLETYSSAQIDEQLNRALAASPQECVTILMTLKSCGLSFQQTLREGKILNCLVLAS